MQYEKYLGPWLERKYGNVGHLKSVLYVTYTCTHRAVCGQQVKRQDPSLTRAISERVRNEFTRNKGAMPAVYTLRDETKADEVK